MEIKGNISASGHFSLDDNGGLSVTGDATFSGSASVGGTGSLSVAGTTSTSGSGTVFGGTGSCTGCTTSGGSSLPIELLSFNLISNEKAVEIKWVTRTQTNNNFFTIEKSKDGEHFVEVTKVEGADNSTEILNYSTFDNNPYQGVSYYRLKQTDFNGKYTRFKMVPITFNLQQIASVYPNPNNGNFMVETNNDLTQNLQVFDVTGKVVLSQQINSKSYVDCSSLNEGVYNISIGNDNNITNKRLVIVR